MTGPSRWRLRWTGVLLLALVLRLLRAAVRWHEDAWLYSVYPAETMELIRAMAWSRLPLVFTGLHPPAWPVLHSLTELLDPRPMWWLLESVVLSTAAVALIGRRSLLAAVVLATAPVAVHYSAEVNQYALLTCALAGMWSSKLPTEGRVARELLAWGVLAAWSHVLGALAAAVAVATLPKQQRMRTLIGLGVAVAPLAVGVGAAAGAEGTFGQPELRWSLVWTDLLGRFGGLGLVLIALAVSAARRAPRLATGVGASVLVVVAFVWARVAAPHQFPYLLTVLPPLVLLVVQVPRSARVLLPLALVQASWQVAFDGQRLRGIVRDLETAGRGVDAAMDQLQTPWTCVEERLEAGCSGDALVLLRPPGRNDDDKTRVSSVLWRLRPWWHAPRISLSEVPLSSADHRYGQPRLVDTPGGSFVVYVHDHVRPTLAQPFNDHERVFLVVSDVGEHSDLLRDAARQTGLTPQAVGPDWLLVQ